MIDVSSVKVIFLWFAFFSAWSYAQPRTFTDQQGRTINAEFLGYSDGSVSLKLNNSTLSSVDISKFSARDQEWIQAQQAETAPVGGSEKISFHKPGFSQSVYQRYLSYAPMTYGFYDENGKLVKKLELNSKSGISGNTYIDKRRKVIMDLSGKELVSAPEGTSFRRNDFPREYLRVRVNNKKNTLSTGFIDHKGNLTSDKTWQQVSAMSENRAFVSEKQPDGSLKYDLIDEKGNHIPLEVENLRIHSVFDSGRSLVSLHRSEKNIYYIGLDGKVAIDPEQYGSGACYRFVDGYAVVPQGIIDPSGKLVFETGDKWFIKSHENNKNHYLIQNRETKGYHIINIENGALTANITDKGTPRGRIDKHGLFIVAHNDEGTGKYGAVNTNGEWVIEPVVCRELKFEGDFIEASYFNGKNKHTGVFNLEGKLILEYSPPAR